MSLTSKADMNMECRRVPRTAAQCKTGFVSLTFVFIVAWFLCMGCEDRKEGESVDDSAIISTKPMTFDPRDPDRKAILDEAAIEDILDKDHKSLLNWPDYYKEDLKRRKPELLYLLDNLETDIYLQWNITEYGQLEPYRWIVNIIHGSTLVINAKFRISGQAEGFGGFSNPLNIPYKQYNIVLNAAEVNKMLKLKFKITNDLTKEELHHAAFSYFLFTKYGPHDFYVIMSPDAPDGIRKEYYSALRKKEIINISKIMDYLICIPMKEPNRLEIDYDNAIYMSALFKKYKEGIDYYIETEPSRKKYEEEMREKRREYREKREKEQEQDQKKILNEGQLKQDEGHIPSSAQSSSAFLPPIDKSVKEPSRYLDMKDKVPYYYCYPHK